MKIVEAISLIGELKTPVISGDPDTLVYLCLFWLSNLDKEIWQNIISKHENTAIEEEYDDEGELITDMPDPTPYEMVEGEGEEPDEIPDVTLIVPEPYSELYLHYLAAQIDYWNGEITRYNNSMAKYNEKYDDYVALFNRTYMPKQDNYISV